MKKIIVLLSLWALNIYASEVLLPAGASYQTGSGETIVCQGNVGGKAKCLSAAANAGWSSERAQNVCSKGIAYAGICIEATAKAGMAIERQERICSLAKIDTAECVSSGVALGWSWDRLEEECK